MIERRQNEQEDDRLAGAFSVGRRTVEDTVDSGQRACTGCGIASRTVVAGQRSKRRPASCRRARAAASRGRMFVVSPGREGGLVAGVEAGGAIVAPRAWACNCFLLPQGP